MINNLFKTAIEYIKGLGDGSLQSACENYPVTCGLQIGRNGFPVVV